MCRDHSRLEQHVPQVTAPTGDCPFPTKSSAIGCDRCQSSECGSHFAGEGADLGHFCDQRLAGNRADKRRSRYQPARSRILFTQARAEHYGDDKRQLHQAHRYDLATMLVKAYGLLLSIKFGTSINDCREQQAPIVSPLRSITSTERSANLTCNDVRLGSGDQS